MKKLLFLFSLIIFSSCSHSIIVWNGKDIIGVGIIGFGILTILFLFFISWVKTKIRDFKNRNKQQ
jgi:hypothetical protein